MEEPTMKQDNKLSVLDNIHARTSIRSYQPKEVEDEKIEQLLRAAMAAPTATNRQPWAFIVIRDKETMNELGSTLPYAKMVKDAPLAIAVCGDLTKAISGAGIEYWVQDASAASENLLLAAQALGLGAVWTGVYPIDERVKEVQKILQLPEQIVPLNVIPIGYPAENPLPKDKWKPENVHYDRWTEPDKK
ncbi:MAG: nitroreductase family protein [Bacteroides cellulosilyticus]